MGCPSLVCSIPTSIPPPGSCGDFRLAFLWRSFSFLRAHVGIPAPAAPAAPWPAFAAPTLARHQSASAPAAARGATACAASARLGTTSKLSHSSPGAGPGACRELRRCSVAHSPTTAEPGPSASSSASHCTCVVWLPCIAWLACSAGWAGCVVVEGALPSSGPGPSPAAAWPDPSILTPGGKYI